MGKIGFIRLSYGSFITYGLVKGRGEEGGEQFLGGSYGCQGKRKEDQTSSTDSKGETVEN